MCSVSAAAYDDINRGDIAVAGWSTSLVYSLLQVLTTVEDIAKNNQIQTLNIL